MSREKLLRVQNFVFEMYDLKHLECIALFRPVAVWCMRFRNIELESDGECHDILEWDKKKMRN